MADRAVHSLACDDYRSEHDDFDTWVDLFEKSIRLAYPAADAAAQKGHCINWLPLKLDEHARTIFDGVSDKTDWDKIKPELSTRLVDPGERYSWLARRGTIIWDRKESLHSLATRIKRSVDKFDPKNADKPREYFIRFRWALPPEYKKAIDMNCAEDRPDLCTIEEAKKIALRVQMANAETGDQPGVATPGEKTVAFSGAAMADDRIKTMELKLGSLETRFGNVETTMGRIAEKVDRWDRGRPNSRDRGQPDNRDRGRSNSRDRDGNREGDRDRGRSGDRNQGRGDSRDRGRDRDRDRRSDGSRDGRFRNSRDSLDRRGGERYRGYYNDRDYDRQRRDGYVMVETSRGRDESRGYRRRTPSYDRRPNYDSRGRYDSRDRRPSRDGRFSGERRPSRDRWDDRRSSRPDDRYYGGDRRDGSRDRQWRHQSEAPMGKAELSADMDFLCNALAEKRLRDKQENS